MMRLNALQSSRNYRYRLNQSPRAVRVHQFHTLFVTYDRVFAVGATLLVGTNKGHLLLYEMTSSGDGVVCVESESRKDV